VVTWAHHPDDFAFRIIIGRVVPLSGLAGSDDARER
jgi:hypothetical protein